MANINLDLRERLPLIRAAHLASRLQAQNPDEAGKDCLYSGPCAVGACLSPAELYVFAAKWDDDSISVLIQHDNIPVTAPEDQIEDWNELQIAHDNWVSMGYEDATMAHKFEDILATLEAKWPPASPQ